MIYIQTCIAILYMKFTMMDLSGMDESKNNCVKFTDPLRAHLKISDRLYYLRVKLTTTQILMCLWVSPLILKDYFEDTQR